MGVLSMRSAAAPSSMRLSVGPCVGVGQHLGIRPQMAFLGADGTVHRRTEQVRRDGFEADGRSG